MQTSLTIGRRDAPKKWPPNMLTAISSFYALQFEIKKKKHK